MKNEGARKADFFIDVDGKRITTESAVSVGDASSRTRIQTLVYVKGASIGHDCELTFASDATTNSTASVTLYSATCQYQDLGSGIAGIMTI